MNEREAHLPPGGRTAAQRRPPGGVIAIDAVIGGAGSVSTAALNAKVC